MLSEVVAEKTELNALRGRGIFFLLEVSQRREACTSSLLHAIPTQQGAPEGPLGLIMSSLCHVVVDFEVGGISQAEKVCFLVRLGLLKCMH